MSKNADIEKAYALIIGISEYKDPGIRRLNYTHADAEGIFKLLTDPKKLGLSKDNIKILLDRDATLFNIKDAISNWLYKKADKDSAVFIFFAGHGGVEEDPRGIEKDNLAKYLLPFDSVLDNLYASALSNRDFNDLLLTIRSKKLVIFMDSCYSGGVSERSRDVKITDDPYKKLGEGEGRLVIAASQPDQRSYEDSRIGHGVFTYNLLQALSGGADYDNDGYMTVFEVYKYLQDSVPRDAMNLAGGKQEPIWRGDLTKDFIISIDRERFEKIEKERVIEEKLGILDAFYDEGKLSGKQYEYLRALLKIDPVELKDKNTKIVKRINDLLSGNISIPTFLENMEVIEPELFAIPVKNQEQERLRRQREEEERKQREKEREKALKKEEERKAREKQLEKERRDFEAREKSAKEAQLKSQENENRLEQERLQRQKEDEERAQREREDKERIEGEKEQPEVNLEEKGPSYNKLLVVASVMGILLLGYWMLTVPKTSTDSEWFIEGIKLSLSGKYQEAITAYDKALEINPKDKEAWLHKGLALESLDRYQEAMAAYDKALEIDPKDKEAWSGKGFALYSLGRYQEAMAAYDKALEIDPKYKEAWLWKGFSLHNLGRYQEAINAYDKALEIDPQYKSAIDNKEIALKKLNQ